jgi:hypothetical protein
MKLRFSAIGAACALILTSLAAIAFACPFCSPESLTLTEETKGADAVVLAKLVKEAPAVTNESTDPNSGTATFEIVEVLRGPETLKPKQEISVVFFGDSDRDKTYLINGLGKETVDWTTPLPLSAAAVEYVRQLPTIPPLGPERLEFFQDYLENADPLLAQDAYDEFARAPYADLIEMKPQMKHDKIVQWIANPEVSPSRRRLYFTMLGVCGTKADVPLLEEMIESDFDAVKPALVGLVETSLSMGGPAGLPLVIEDVQTDERRKKLGLDALVACYLILKGPDGLNVIEKRFLSNPHAEYTHIYSTIMALRFHGDEHTEVLPRERLLASMRLLLKNPDFADQVILDLSRWEDWSVMDQIVEMFKNSDAKGYVRQPAVSYLTVASEQKGDVAKRATAALEELEKLDPETVKTARSLMAFGALGRARAATPSTGDTGSDVASSTDDAKSATADASQGFAASPEDEKTDTSQIPDPAAFGAEAAGAKKDTSEGSPAARAGAQSAPKRTTAAKVAVNGATASPAVMPTDAPAAHPVLLAGVPLAAAAVLMGVYLLILRMGAV